MTYIIFNDIVSSYMSDIERADAWRVKAEAAISRGDDPDIDAAAQEREEHLTSQMATSEVYEAWFRDELLPMHEETWRLALRSLVQYGHPLRCSGLTYPKHALSTGTLSVGTPRQVGERGMDALATGLRLSITHDKAVTTRVRRAIAKSQQDPHNKKQLRQAVDKVDEAVRNESTIGIEAITVSTNRDRLNWSMRSSFSEVEYPRTWRQRMNNFHDEKSKRLVREAMQTPDLHAHYAPLYVFQYPREGWRKTGYASHEMALYPPAMFTPDSLKYSSGQDGLEEAQQAAHREVARIATLGSMLIAVERPLRDTVAFQPRH